MSEKIGKELTEEQKKLINDNMDYAVLYARQSAKRYQIYDRSELKSMALLALVEAAVKYDPAKGPFKRFLDYAIRQAIIDTRRKENSLKKNILEENMDAFQPKANECHQDLRFAIDALKDTHKEMLIDYYFKGLSQPEIAAKNNISTTAVCRQLKRILKKIKAELC